MNFYQITLRFLQKSNKKNNMQHIPGLGVGINYSLHRQKKKKKKEKKDFFLHFSIKPRNMHASYDFKQKNICVDVVK